MTGYKIFKGYRKMLIGWKIKEGDCYLSVFGDRDELVAYTSAGFYNLVGTKVIDHIWYRPIKRKPNEK